MASKAAIPKFRYLSAWFCPFAHRSTIALEHHRSRIEWEWVEALGWEQRADEHNVTGTGSEWWYHWKSEELKRSNDSALVPTLIPIGTDGESIESKAVYESLIVNEYIDAVSSAPECDRLVPSDPFEAARCRLWAERVNRDCCSPYYGVLVRTDDNERREHFDQIIRGIKAFSAEIRKTSGPTFLSDGRLSTVDIALIPWSFRYYVLEHYRGSEYVLPLDDEELAPYHLWFDCVMNMDSVKRTLPDKQRYLEHIGKYADSSARSKVANAVRRGVAAHELDDDKDSY